MRAWSSGAVAQAQAQLVAPAPWSCRRSHNNTTNFSSVNNRQRRVLSRGGAEEVEVATSRVLALSHRDERIPPTVQSLRLRWLARLVCHSSTATTAGTNDNSRGSSSGRKSEEGTQVVVGDDKEAREAEVDKLHREARRLSKKGGRYRQEATELFEEILEREPEHLKVLLSYALHLARKGDNAKAEELFVRACDLSRTQAPAWQAFGRWQAERGNEDKALTLLLKAVEIDPDHAPAWHALAQFHEHRGRPKQAETCYLQALKGDESHAPSLQCLGLLRARKGSLNPARGFFRRWDMHI